LPQTVADPIVLYTGALKMTDRKTEGLEFDGLENGRRTPHTARRDATVLPRRVGRCESGISRGGQRLCPRVTVSTLFGQRERQEEEEEEETVVLVCERR